MERAAFRVGVDETVVYKDFVGERGFDDGSVDGADVVWWELGFDA